MAKCNLVNIERKRLIYLSGSGPEVARYLANCSRKIRAASNIG